MFDQFKIVTLFFKNNQTKKAWQTLLTTTGIERFSEVDIQSLDCSYGIYDNEKLVATISYSGNLIKYIAILEDYKEDGKTFNRLVSQVLTDFASLNKFQSFVVTKPIYQKSFEYLGFKTIAKTDQVVFLENGLPNIQTFLGNIPKKEGEKAGIVMNANPFTKGHQHLITVAAEENDWVYVFLLEKEQDVFSTEDRLNMMKKGTSHLKNVVIVLGGFYIISPFTFPTYFLRKNDETTCVQTKLDAIVFKEIIAENLGITHRYIGEEPLSPMTNTYNETLKEILEPEIKVHLIPRITTNQAEIISATKIRTAYKNKNLDKVSDMLPDTTKKILEELIASKGV